MFTIFFYKININNLLMHNYFTITAGRTGSAWLASFLSQNLNINEVHEFLGINDFGHKMPDIRTMRNFNNFGNNEFVQNFWKRKFEYIPNELYSETNHTLCKCGLVENIILNKREKYTTLIILKRDMTDQCVSYLERNDFGNITIAWQWYLHPSYLKKIINPKPFMQFGNLGQPLWYCYEMAARQEYYSQKFSDKVKMIEITLEEVVTNIGAKKLHLDSYTTLCWFTSDSFVSVIFKPFEIFLLVKTGCSTRLIHSISFYSNFVSHFPFSIKRH